MTQRLESSKRPVEPVLNRALLRVIQALTLAALSLFPSFSSSAYAGGTMPSESGMAKRILFHGKIAGQPISDGQHTIHFRLYRKDGALVHDEDLRAEVRQGTYDILIGSAKQLIANSKDDYIVAVSVDDGKEVRDGTHMKLNGTINESMISVSLEQQQNRMMEPLDRGEVSAAMAEHDALDHGLISNPYYDPLPTIAQMLSPLHGLNVEMSLASPGIPTTNYYDMAKYGRINVEYNNFASFDDDPFGMAAEAMHVAHHLLLYAGGFTSDVNNDGMFLFTFGAAHYQVGNNRDEPFVDAPFMRFKCETSRATIFGYSEIETTVHERSYLSGTIGVGLRVSSKIQVIAGLHHTEFFMPTEDEVREVDGFHGIVNWAF